MALWTLREVAAALGVAFTGVDAEVAGVSIDSRTLKRGELFVALSGTPSGGFKSSFASGRDGHEFVAAAEAAGACAAVVSRVVEGVKMPQLVVADTLMDGLWKLGAAGRARFGGKVVGLTGSAGKTTTKEMLAAMLGEVGETSAAVGSYNNFWGVPLTLARLPREADFAVIEMGMNTPGEIGRLSALARPDVALVVNVKPVHVEHLGSLEAIRIEKLSIAEGLDEKGVLVVPAELGLEGCPWGGRVMRVGGGGEVHVVRQDAVGTDWMLAVDVAGQEVEMVLREGAPHRLHNALAALSCAYALGVDVRRAAAGLAKVGLMVGRGAVLEVAGIMVVDDSFNGNPASMAAALDALRARPVAGRRVAVLGDMLELGAEEVAHHVGLAEKLGRIDGVFCVGPLMKNLYDVLPDAVRWGYFPDPTAVDFAAIAKALRAGDAVVLKGSKKMLYVNKAVDKLVAELQR